MRDEDHRSLHNSGENHPMFGKHHLEETKKKISEANKGMYGGENNPRWKNYARIIRSGKQNGKQVYAIKFNGKNIKYSYNKEKLMKWFKKEYPNEKLEVGV
jgi:hypothetical protein